MRACVTPLQFMEVAMELGQDDSYIFSDEQIGDNAVLT